MAVTCCFISLMIFSGIVTAVRACGSSGGSVAKGMTKISYSGYRFPPEIIQQAIWLYLRFTLSFRDVEDLLVERGIMVSYETVRRWVNHFGPKIAAGRSATVLFCIFLSCKRGCPCPPNRR